MAKDWFNIRTKTEPKALGAMANTIRGFPKEVTEKYFFQKIQQIVAGGADIQREYLRQRPNYTKTGVKRAAAGNGEPGRYTETHEMYSSIKWSAKKISDTQYKFNFGWLDGAPGYAIFQEYGTKNGIQGMESLAYAMEHVRIDLKALANGNGTTTRKASRYNFVNGAS